MKQIKLVEKKVPNGTRKEVANATGVWLFPLVHVEQEAFTKTNPSGAPAPPPFQQGRQIVLHVGGRGMKQIELVERKCRTAPNAT